MFLFKQGQDNTNKHFKCPFAAAKWYLCKFPSLSNPPVSAKPTARRKCQTFVMLGGSFAASGCGRVFSGFGKRS